MGPVFSKTLDLIARRRPITVFLRNDDVDIAEDSLRRLIDLCVELQVALSLAIVPGLLTDEAGIYLQGMHRRHPEILELHQHGWMHRNHQPGGPAAEFGSSRSFDLQLADIASGARRMREVFADAWFPAFTPPWHACTSDTLRALTALGFSAFSGSVNQVQSWANQTGLCLVPVTLDLEFEFQPAFKPGGETAIRLFEHMVDHHFAGLLVHHKVMSPASFAMLRTILTSLRAHPAIHFATLKDLAGAEPRFVFSGPSSRFQPAVAG